MNHSSTIVVRIFDISSKINEESLRKEVVNIGVLLLCFTIVEFDESSSSLLVPIITKVDEMPFQVFVVMLDVLPDIGVASTNIVSV
jgi:hypothetical protein